MAPEVGGLDRGVVADRSRGAGGEHGALDEHGHDVGDLEDEIHVMLDQQYGVIAREGFQKGGDAFAFFLAHAGERFIEEKDFRIGCERHGDLELALLAVAEFAGDAGAGVREADALDGGIGGIDEGELLQGRIKVTPRTSRSGALSSRVYDVLRT